MSRQVFELAAQIEPGNSSGPLLSGSGAVLDVVFARSTQSLRVGYAYHRIGRLRGRRRTRVRPVGQHRRLHAMTTMPAVAGR